jgi:hypothetical protein
MAIGATLYPNSTEFVQRIILFLFVYLYILHIYYNPLILDILQYLNAYIVTL